jgi:hypothetical protein
MGTFGVGFLQAVGQKAQEKAQQIQQQELAEKQRQAQIYNEGLQASIKAGGMRMPDGSWHDYTPDEIQAQIKYANDNISKIYGNSKPIKQLYEKVGQLMHGAHTHPDMMGRNPQGPTPPFIAPGTNAPSGAMPAPPTAKASDATPDVATDAQAAPISKEQGDSVLSGGALPPPPSAPKGAGAQDPVQAAVDTPPQAPKPAMAPPPSPGGAAPVNPVTAATPQVPLSTANMFWRGAYPSQDAQQKAALDFEQKKQDILHKNKMEEIQAKPFTGSPRIGKPLTGDMLPENALDVNGDPIERDSGKTFYPVIKGNTEYYEQMAPGIQVKTIGNYDYEWNPYTHQIGRRLGIHNAGTESNRPFVGTDASGNPIQGNLRVSHKPISPGADSSVAEGASPQAPPVEPPNPTLKRRPQPPVNPASPLENHASSSPVAAAPDSAKVVPSNNRGALPLPMAQYKAFRDQSVPVREAATQVFGDPTQPDIRPFSSFAPLADNKEARTKIGTALRLTFDGLEQSEKAAGSLTQLIENEGGVPNALAKSQSDVMQKAVGELTPEERQAYDATMSLYGTVIGLRSLTKASGAQFSVRQLENELPIIGINSVSSSQVYNRLSRLAEQVYNGTKGNPVFKKSERDFYDSQASKMKKFASASEKSPSKKNTPPPSMKSSNPVEDIINKYGIQVAPQ